jgi:PadR family transcriptional regulator
MGKDGDPAPRMTLSTRMVLQALLAKPDQEMYGLQISQTARLPSGTIHPILARLERLGWLESSWEDIDPVKEGRPCRRYYRLSAKGAVSAPAALARVGNPGIVVLRPGLAGGA